MNPVAIMEAITGGRAATEYPKWLGKTAYRHTWITQYDRSGFPINCAAFALSNWLHSGGRTPEPPIPKFAPISAEAIRRTQKLKSDLGFGDRVTMMELKAFTDRYSSYRLVMIAINIGNLEASLVSQHVGEQFDPSQPVSSNICYMISYKDHWSLCASPNALLNKIKNGGTYKYCDNCPAIVRTLTGQPPACCASLEDREEPKKALPCRVDLCGNFCLIKGGRYHTDSDPCPNRTCKTCHMGFPKDKPHRCLVLPSDMDKEHPQDKYWNESEKRYEFCTSADDDGSKPAFFAYDFECQLRTEDLPPSKVPESLPHPSPDERYATDLGHFTELEKRYTAAMMEAHPDLRSFNLSGKIKRFEVNMIVCANIFTGTVPKHPEDPPYTPETKTFRGENCVVEFIEYLLGYNKGRVYAYAHNGSGFDTKFIFEAVLKMNHLSQNSILRGSNFMSFDVSPRGRGANKTVFGDSMLHLPGSLQSLLNGWFGKSSDPNLRGKGYFPHKFNTVENQDYV